MHIIMGVLAYNNFSVMIPIVAKFPTFIVRTINSNIKVYSQNDL